jgi:hypothetical protein
MWIATLGSRGFETGSPAIEGKPLGWAYAMKGMYTQAIGEYDKMPESALAPENQLVGSVQHS